MLDPFHYVQEGVQSLASSVKYSQVLGKILGTEVLGKPLLDRAASTVKDSFIGLSGIQDVKYKPREGTFSALLFCFQVWTGGQVCRV